LAGDSALGRQRIFLSKETVATPQYESNVGAICTEPQYQPTLANTIVQETNIPLIQIDPVASGPDNPSLDYYITTMQANIQNILKLQTNRKEK